MTQDFINGLSITNLLTLNEMINDSLKGKSSDEKFKEAQKLQEQLKNVKNNKDYDAVEQRLKILNTVSGFNCL